MTIELDFQNQLPESSGYIPTEKQFTKWLDAAAVDVSNDSEVTVRIVDEAEMQSLNYTYRDKNCPTNVLSFPADLPEDIDLALLGDIVICGSVVNKEADQQSKTPEEHWAHMVIHGVLHLLGYDHIKDQEAELMESKEVEILQQLGFKNPY